jgi:FkbM family methyltransferase
MLRNFEKLVTAKNVAAGTVVHIGAGLCSELPQYQHLKFENIQLIEANSDLADQLVEKVKGIDHVKVSNLLIAGKDGLVPFVRTSNPRFDSLKKPAALKEYFPNIKVVSESAVKSVSLDSVIRKFTLDKNKQNVLVLELQGAETDILESVTPANLQQFFWVVIKTSELALYDNELENVPLSKVMESSAFDPAFTEELTFPFCVKMYKRNDCQLALYNAQFNIDKLESDLESSHKSLAASNSQIEALRQEKATLESDLDSSHKSFAASNSQIEALRQEKATLESDLDSSHKSFAASNSQIEALRQEKATLESDLDSSHKSFAASNSQIEALRQEKATLESDLDSSHKSFAASNSQIEELRHEKATLESDLDSSHTSFAASNSQIEALRQEKATLESDLDSSHKSFAASNSQIEALRQEKATLESDLDSSHKSFAASNSQIEALRQEKATLESDLDSSHKSFAASNSQIEALRQEKATLESDLDSSHKSFAASNSQIEALRQEKATLQKNKSWAESLNKQCEELKVYSAERQQSADLALKLQTKAQVDLENLREKYQLKHINEQKLVALISELRAKLQQASEYYYELQEKHPELNELTQTQVERSHIDESQTANVAELEKKTRPAKRKISSKQAKSVTRGKS